MKRTMPESRDIQAMPLRRRKKMSRTMIVFAVCQVLAATTFADDWPGWRGEDRSDVSNETGLLKQWPADGPKRVWLSKDAGIGYAGFAIVDGKLYTMGAYSDAVDIICLDANTGKWLWSTTMTEAVYANDRGDGPRGTPTVDGDYVYAMSGEGNLVCVKRDKGEKVWSASMKDFGGSVPQWGYAESVLVDGDKLICTPGGRAGTVLALNKLTGEKIWQSEEWTDRADYSSVIAAEHNGVRQYIQLTQQTLVGVAAADGRVLWRSSWPGRIAVVPTPIFRDGKVYVSSGYGVGCMLVKLAENAAEEVYANKNMKNHHGGVILVGDHLYGYSDNVGWLCQHFETGEKVWAEREALGKGAIAYADGMLYCLSEDDGHVVLAEASPEGWNERGRFTLDPQTEYRSARGMIWTHPVIANGKLYLRDQDHVYCYDVKAD
jgi:outer membrane protein assembly factor BamB